MSLTQDTITAALKKLGPVSPGHLAAHLGEAPHRVKTVVNAMLEAGELKATGVTLSRRLALPEQNFDDATSAAPQRRTAPKKKHKGNGKKARHAKRGPRAAAAPAVAEHPFISALDGENRLVCINGGAP